MPLIKTHYIHNSYSYLVGLTQSKPVLILVADKNIRIIEETYKAKFC